MKPNYLLLPLALFFSSSLFFSPSSAHNKTHESPPLPSSHKDCFSKVYAFGDSYTDTGNAQALGWGGHASSPPRSCDGRLVIDFLCEALSLPSLPPYKADSSDFTFGVNFAIAGSTALPTDLFSLLHKFAHPLMWKGVFVNLQTQVDWFNKFLLGVECKGKSASSCRAELGNALFWIGATGVNDYARTVGSSAPLHRLSDMSVGYTCKLIQTLLDSGAKYIVVQGLPPVGCLPSGISSCSRHDRDKTGCASAANSAIMIHNEILQRKLADFQRQFPDCKILYADYWNAYLEILTNSAKYHFEEPFKACCGDGSGELNFNLNCLCGSAGTSTCDNPGKYINWDGIHLTEAMHLQITDLFLNHGFCRPSFDQLVKSKSGI